MNKAKKLFRSTFHYDIICLINDVDLSNDLLQVEIIRRLDYPYSLYALRFISDTDIRKTIDKISPKDNIKLIIEVYNNGELPIKKYEIDLVYMLDYAPMPVKIEYDIKSLHQGEKRYLSIFAIPKNGIKAVTNYVQNQIFENKTVKNILDSISHYPISYTPNPHNTLPIEQYLVEKQSFIKELRKINKLYGLYKGPFMYFFDEFKNYWKFADLNHLVNIDKYYTMFHLSIDKFSKEKIQELDKKIITEMGDFYITHDDITRIDHFPVKLFNSSYNFRMVSHPKNKLYHVKNYTSETLLQQHGIISGEYEYNANDILKQRFINQYDQLGHEYDDVWMRNQIVDDIWPSVEAITSINLFVDLETLYPGRICMYSTKHIRYLQFMGKYVTKDIRILYTNDGGIWHNDCRVKIWRTNYNYK